MKVIKTIEAFAKEKSYNKVIEAATRVGEESKVYVDDIDLDSGKTVKAVEIIGAINAFPTEKEFKKYFYDQYGENAFGEGEIEVIIKYYNLLQQDCQTYHFSKGFLTRLIFQKSETRWSKVRSGQKMRICA